MPHPSSRLDLYLVPRGNKEEVRASLNALMKKWEDLGWVGSQGQGSTGMHGVVRGGCVRVRVDLPDGMVLYANQQGGFRVNCGQCGHNLSAQIPMIRKALAEGSGVGCEGCGWTLENDSLDFQPPGAFGYGAMVLCDVGAFEVVPEVRESVLQAIGPYDVVGRRT